MTRAPALTHRRGATDLAEAMEAHGAAVLVAAPALAKVPALPALACQPGRGLGAAAATAPHRRPLGGGAHR